MARIFGPLLALLACLALTRSKSLDEWNPAGYILYCPCMGRFTNQVDQLLGSLFFAQAVGRVLVIPPFIHYPQEYNSEGNGYIPFDEVFDLEALQEHHDVITMEHFMANLAPSHWPKGQRKAYCPLKSAELNQEHFSGELKCPREGNPFGTFWEAMEISFDESVTWENLHYNVDHEEWRQGWLDRFPASEHPVLALMGAPAQYPVTQANEPLQRHLVWQQSIRSPAEQYIDQTLTRPYLAIHLRNGADWVSACAMTDSGVYKHLMSSQQCVGYHRDRAEPVTRKMCIQLEDQVGQEVKHRVKATGVKSVYIATDHAPMIDDIRNALAGLDVTVHHLDPEKPYADLYIMAAADHFHGNCVSSFTAFAKRQRDLGQQTTTFFGWEGPKHDEL